MLDVVGVGIIAAALALATLGAACAYVAYLGNTVQRILIGIGSVSASLYGATVVLLVFQGVWRLLSSTP